MMKYSTEWKDNFDLSWSEGGATKFPAFTSQERAAMVAWELANGKKMSTKDVQNLTELKPRAARELLTKLARVLPIRRMDGVWSSL